MRSEATAFVPLNFKCSISPRVCASEVDGAVVCYVIFDSLYSNATYGFVQSMIVLNSKVKCLDFDGICAIR